MVKVSAWPGPKERPAPDHANHVPPATLTGASTANPAGVTCVSPVTTAETVSVTARLVSTAFPLFVSTSRYVITSPGFGLAGTCVLTTVMLGTGAATNVHTVLVSWLVAWHAVFASTTPRLHTVVSTHTWPSTPVTVNVKLWPGTSSTGPLAVHTHRVPPATATAVGGV